MKSLVLPAVLLSVFFTSCIGEIDVPGNTYRANFETLWEIVDTRYCYFDVKEIDWDSVYLVYNAKLGNDTVDEIVFFDAMGDMLAELRDGHVNLYSSFDRSRYWNWYTDYPANFNKSVLYNESYLGEKYRTVHGLQYQRIAGGKVGYVYYPSFSTGFSDTNISYMFQYFQHCQGLIIDVRNNGGGSADLAGKLASYFFERDTISLYMSHKIGWGHNEFSEPKPVKTEAHTKLQWQRPVIVLTNRSSYSATNSFVCRMKDAPNGLIIGDKTGGGGGLPLSNELPNGWMVRFSSTPMFDGQLQHIESGIDPDIRIDLDSADVAKGKDTLIDYAVGKIMQWEF